MQIGLCPDDFGQPSSDKLVEVIKIICRPVHLIVFQFKMVEMGHLVIIGL